MRAAIGKLFQRALEKHGVAIRDLQDFVDWHLDRREAEHNERVLRVLTSLVLGP
jgi:hypothetical protein